MDIKFARAQIGQTQVGQSRERLKQQMRANYVAAHLTSTALITLLVSCLLSRTATLTYSQELVQPLFLEQVASGIYVHADEIALMSEENEGAIANLGVVLGDE